MVEPIFETENLSSFARQLAIEKIFNDHRIFGSKNLIISEFLVEPHEEGETIYFDGKNTRVYQPIQITKLKDIEDEFEPSLKSFDPFETLFVFYKNFFDLQKYNRAVRCKARKIYTTVSALKRNFRFI